MTAPALAATLLREGAADMPSGSRSEPGPAVPSARISTLPAVAVFLLVKVRPSAVPWLLMRLVRGPRALRGVDGLRFCRVLGSGQGGGFVLRPGLDHGRGSVAAVRRRGRRPRPSSGRSTRWWQSLPSACADELCLVAMLRASVVQGVSWAGQSIGGQCHRQVPIGQPWLP
jgi:hypothetical protein